MAGGDGEKRYEGARGPRKTPARPKNRPRRDPVVTQLFGEEAAAAAEERRPKKDMPVPNSGGGGEKRVQKRRTKIRIGERWTRALDRIEAEGMTMADFVKELSPEELARGQLKAPDGSFGGPPVKWVPAEFYRECIRELMRRGKTLYQENYIDAIQAMTTLATDPRVDPGQRIRAAQFVIERIEGKVPERLEIGASEPWQELITGIVASVEPGSPMRAFEPVDGARGSGDHDA